jgi:hypothetical protein
MHCGRSSLCSALASALRRVHHDRAFLGPDLGNHGELWRTLPCPIPPGQRHRLQGVRLAGPAPLPEAAMTVQRRVSSRGGIMVARQKIQAGMSYAGKIVTVVCEDSSFRLVIDGETVRVVPGTTGQEVGRYKASATRPGRR